MDTSRENDTTTPEHTPVSPTTPTPETPVASVAPVPEEAGLQPSFFARNKSTIIAVIIALAILLGTGYYLYITKYGGATVAVVNGTRIYQKDFDESVALIEQNAILQGYDVENDEAARIEIRNQALETLISNALIMTAAEEVGIKADESLIQEKYDELATQLGGAAALTERMTEMGLTEEKLRANIKERIIADAYIEAETDIENLTIDDAQVLAFLENIKKNAPEGTELPPLEEIRPQIEAQLKSEKQQQIVTDLIAKLRSEATVEVKI